MHLLTLLASAAWAALAPASREDTESAPFSYFASGFVGCLLPIRFERLPEVALESEPEALMAGQPDSPLDRIPLPLRERIPRIVKIPQTLENLRQPAMPWTLNMIQMTDDPKGCEKAALGVLNDLSQATPWTSTWLFDELSATVGANKWLAQLGNTVVAYPGGTCAQLLVLLCGAVFGDSGHGLQRPLRDMLTTRRMLERMAHGFGAKPAWLTLLVKSVPLDLLDGLAIRALAGKALTISDPAKAAVMQRQRVYGSRSGWHTISRALYKERFASMASC